MPDLVRKLCPCFAAAFGTGVTYAAQLPDVPAREASVKTPP